jgi:hypothetical protein
MMNKLMNRVAQLAVTLAFGLFLVPFAHAGEPALNAKELGIVEAVLNICGKVDPAAATKLQERIAELSKGASNDAVARARAGDEYRKAYDSMQQLVGTFDESNAKKACSESVAPNP